MRTTNKTDRLAARNIYLPNDRAPRLILEHENGSSLYTYEYELHGVTRFVAIAFWGTSAKPLFNFSYRTEDARNARIQEFKLSVESSIERKAQRRTEKSAWTNPLTVGTILYTSWGYDQTNVEFYAVTRVSGRRVWVREIAADYEATGYMSGNTWPAMPIRFVGEETMHVAQPSGARGVYVKISESQHAWVDEGKQHSTTSYA